MIQQLAQLTTAKASSGILDINPCTREEIKLYGDVLTLGPPLGQDELDTFRLQFATLLTAPGSVERAIMVDRIEQYIMGLRAIKHALKDVKFTGLNAGAAEIGFGLLRPQFFRSNAPGVSVVIWRANWQQNFPLANTWTDWIMNGTGLPYSVGLDFGVIISHIKPLNPAASFLSEMQVTVGRTGALIPFDVRSLRIADNENQVSIAAIPTIIATPTNTLYIQGKADIIGLDDIELGGLVVGLGRVLAQLVPTWL